MKNALSLKSAPVHQVGSIVYVAGVALVFAAGSTLGTAALLLLASAPAYYLAVVLQKDVERRFRLAHYFWPVGLLAVTVLLLFVDYEQMTLGHLADWVAAISRGDIVALAILVLLLFALYAGSFFARTVLVRSIALITMALMGGLVFYLLPLWTPSSRHIGFIGAVFVGAGLGWFFFRQPSFWERVFGRIPALPPDAQRDLAHRLDDDLNVFVALLRQPDHLWQLADLIWASFGAQRRPMLVAVLQEAQRRLASADADSLAALLEHAIEKVETPVEKVKRYEFIEAVEEMSVARRIDVARLYLDEAVAQGFGLSHHLAELLSVFNQAVWADRPYPAGLASVLYRCWLDKNRFGELADGLEQIRPYLEAFVRVEGLPVALERLSDPPAFHRGAKSEHLQDLVRAILQEDGIDINGSNVDVWLVKDERAVLQHLAGLRLSLQALQRGLSVRWSDMPTFQLILCGHSIAPVCRRVTALINQAKEELANADDKFTAGFALLHNEPDAAASSGAGEDASDDESSVFERLERSLNELAEQTGLLTIHYVSREDVEQKKQRFRQAADLLRERGATTINVIDKDDAREIPAVVPIYRIEDEGLVALSWTIPQALAKSKTFHDILLLYRQMSFLNMEAELHRKVSTIEFWKAEAMQRQTRIKYNLEEGGYLRIPEAHKQDSDVFIKSLSDEELPKYGYYANRQVSYDHIRGLVREELIHEYVSWEERLKQHDHAIEEHQWFLDFYRRQIEKVEVFEKDAGEGRFEGDMIDIMLRKWDLGFQFDSLKSLFDQWVDEVRPSFWKVIEEKLGVAQSNVLRAVPNLWFDVTKDAERDTYQIRPCVVVNANHVKLIRRHGLIVYDREPAEAEVTGAVPLTPGMAMHELTPRLDVYLSRYYEQTIDAFVQAARDMIHFAPHRVEDVPARLQEIAEKRHFQRMQDQWRKHLFDEERYQAALDVLDAMEETYPTVPEIAYWRALVFAKSDADAINQANAVRLYMRGGEAVELPFELLLKYLAKTKDLDAEVRKQIEYLIGNEPLAYEEDILEELHQIRKLDETYYNKLKAGQRIVISNAYKAILETQQYSAREQALYEFYLAVELLKLIDAFGAVYRKSKDLTVETGEALKQQYDALLRELKAIRVPSYVGDDVGNLVRDLILNQPYDELYAKIFLTPRLDVVLERLFIQCYKHLDVAYQNNETNHLVYDFYSWMLYRGLNLRRAMEVLFPARFPLAFLASMQFSPDSETMAYEANDIVQFVPEADDIVLQLVREDTATELGRVATSAVGGEAALRRLQESLEKALAEEQAEEPIIYKHLLTRLLYDAVPDLHQRLGEALSGNTLNVLIRAFIYGNHPPFDASVLEEVGLVEPNRQDS